MTRTTLWCALLVVCFRATLSLPRNRTQFSLGQNCSDVHLRYHENHTLCRPAADCEIQVAGIENQVKQLILKLHNHYRNLIATGNQTDMPPATNMMELEWDDDLASVAQAHANQCHFDHDCPSCRQMEKFTDVGQNLCLDRTTRHNPQPDWESCIRRWYDEVSMFPNNTRSPFVFDVPTGHFTQMVWATTWKIGCGYTRYPSTERPFVYDLLYTCDYGPGGNLVGGDMYEDGEVCSKCPEGTCCGSGCDGQAVETRFKGLCKSTTPEGPMASHGKNNLIWACMFNNQTKESCDFKSDPAEAFWIKNSFSSGYLETIVEGGQKAKVTFTRLVKSATGLFCINIEYAKGPNAAGERSNNALKIHLTSPGLDYFQVEAEMGRGIKGFQTYAFSMSVYLPVKVAFSFSVPANSTAQYLNIHKLIVSEGACAYNYR